jgi:hypothetical protein
VEGKESKSIELKEKNKDQVTDIIETVTLVLMYELVRL